jgi:ABC-type cobalamin/Fe3+-siderophores transport system ATPase subunit
MKLLVLHLSDLHFEIGKPFNTVRTDAIVDVSLNVDNQIASVLLVLSGDIACRGVPSYSFAEDFISRLKSKLREKVGLSLDIEICTVAGNHDIDTTVLGDETINVLAADIIGQEKQPSTSMGIYSTLLKGQASYSSFQDRVSGRPAKTDVDKLISEFSFVVGENCVRVRTLNTAVMSRKHETQGCLWFPLEVLDASIRTDPEKANDFSICVYHHPDKWLESNNANKFRARTESASDLILMGHQHTEESYYAESLAGDTTWYSAGAALQMVPDTSTGFCAIIIDFAERKRRRVAFKWDGRSYISHSDTQWKALASNDQARSAFVLSHKFEEYLDDPGSLIVHTQKKRISLTDIYEPCRLRVKGTNITKDNTVIVASDLNKFLEDKQKIVIFGDAQSGKTTLAKQLFRQAYKANGSSSPILLNGRELRSPKEIDVERWIKRGFEAQYNLPSFREYKALSPERRLVIVDGWHDVLGNENAKVKVFQSLEKWFARMVLMADNWYQLEEFSTAIANGSYTVSLTKLLIMPYVALQRTNMVERWVMLGRHDTLDATERVYAVDAVERHLDEMTVTGLLPKYPLHILSALQTFQAVMQSEPDMGAQGHLYDTLVEGTLKAMSRDTPELSINRQFIAFIAGELFDKEKQSVSLENIEFLNDQYFKDYAVRVDVKEFLGHLVIYRILRLEDGNYSFRERYVYYYFVAEYFTTLLAKRLLRDSALERLKEMAGYLAYEEYAQVLMFVIYKTRNSELIDEVIINSQMIFENAKVCDLDGDMAFVNTLRIEKPMVTLPNQDVEENRKDLRKALSESEDRPAITGQKVRYDSDLDDLAKLHHAFKSMQMMGRVLRNFPGTLEADTKRQLAGACYELGLRTLSMLSKGVESELPEAKVTIFEALKEKYGTRHDDKELEKRVDSILTTIVITSSIVLISTISSAVGSHKLRETYRQLGTFVERTPATDLVGISIELENFRDIPLDTLGRLEKEFRSKFVAFQVLRFLVWKRLVFLPVTNRSIRQQLCDRFDIAVTPPMITATAESHK